MKPSEEQLRSFLVRKLGDDAASLMTPARLQYLLDNDLYNEQLLRNVRPEDLKESVFSLGLRNRIVEAFKTASEGVRGQAVASKDLQLFAEMAPKAMTEGDWLSLDADFLGDPSLGRVMYVREAYVELRKVLESFKERGIGHAVISGNPGLGKSWFAIFMLIRNSTRSS
ncbi:g10754 [Coccomyxa elongata]